MVLPKLIYIVYVLHTTCASMRKRGVARAMIDGACMYARDVGVEHMYVHVVDDNVAARKLYEKCGFCVEQKEQANVARGLNRPPRLLLHKELCLPVSGR